MVVKRSSSKSTRIGPNSDYYVSRIMSVLNFATRRLTTKEVSYYAHIDWGTAQNYLLYLKRRGKVSSKSVGRVTYWRVKGFF